MSKRKTKAKFAKRMAVRRLLDFVDNPKSKATPQEIADWHRAYDKQKG